MAAASVEHRLKVAVSVAPAPQQRGQALEAVQTSAARLLVFEVLLVADAALLNGLG